MKIFGREIPEWALNVGMHAVSGFAIGFCSVFVVDPAGAFSDFTNAIYGASVIGMYGAVKEVMEYIKSKTSVNTKAGGAKIAPLPLLKRML
jgi:hypothetical protein